MLKVTGFYIRLKHIYLHLEQTWMNARGSPESVNTSVSTPWGVSDACVLREDFSTLMTEPAVVRRLYCQKL